MIPDVTLTLENGTLRVSVLLLGSLEAAMASHNLVPHSVKTIRQPDATYKIEARFATICGSSS